MRSELLKGHLELMLLAVIADGPAHGYALIQELKRRSAGAFDLPEGSIYPALQRLERDRLVSSRWSAGSGRRRRTYVITRSGERELATRSATWREFTSAVDVVLGGIRNESVTDRHLSG